MFLGGAEGVVGFLVEEGVEFGRIGHFHFDNPVVDRVIL